MRLMLSILALTFVPHIHATEYVHPTSMTTSARNLLLDAINGDGNAIGFLYDNVSNGIRQRLHLDDSAVVQGVVSTVQIIDDECSRLKLTLIVPDVKIARYIGGPEEMLSIWYELNFCKNGQPPETDNLNNDEIETVIEKYYGK